MTDFGYLNRKHRYYIQVQGQLLVTGLCDWTLLDFVTGPCDFFIWTPSSHKLEQIYPDTHLWEKLEKKLTWFFVTYVLPEILTGRIKQAVESNSDKENVYCKCQKSSAGCMIACDNHKCKYKWFYYQYVGIKCAPKGTWFCSDGKKVKS